MHRLVGQRAEFGTQRRDHPARQVQVAPFGGAEVLLDRNHLLLADESRASSPATACTATNRRHSGHVLAHDLRRVLRDIQAGLEAILRLHARNGFWIDGIPGAALAGNQSRGGLEVVGIL